MMSEFVYALRRVVAGPILLLVLGLAVPAAPAGADAVNVPNVTLLPNTPNQIVTITITGATAVAGEDFFAQIGDGGAFNHGVNVKPVFTNVDILTGTIFGANNTGATRDPNGPETAHPLIWVDGTTTNSGTVTDGGLLATLTVDTTGVNSGTFPLLLKGVGNTLTAGGFTTDLVDGNGVPIPLTINDGSITIGVAPEPVGLPLMAGVMGWALAQRRRR